LRDQLRHPRLADRLAGVRRATFIARERELALFASALAEPAAPFTVLYVHGPGGVGKTTLLREFARVAAEARHTVVHIDARNIQPSPRALREALAETIDAAHPGSGGTVMPDRHPADRHL